MSAAPTVGRIRTWWVTAATLSVVFALLLTAGPARGLEAAVDVALTGVLLEAGGSALLMAASVVCAVRWKLTSDAVALLLSVATLIMGVFASGLGQMLPLVSELDQQVGLLTWLRPGARLVSMLLFAAALVIDPVDMRLRFWRVVGGAVVAVVVVTAALQSAPGAGSLVTGLDAFAAPSRAASAGLAVAWTLLAGGFAIRAIRDRSLLLAWFVLVLAGFAVSELILVLHGTTPAALLDLRLIRTLGVAAALAGAVSELERAFSTQSERLLESVVERGATEARMRSWRAETDERAHEAANALAAIAGASRTLQHFHDRLDHETRETLHAALGSEIGRLQGLLRDERQPVAAFRLRDVVNPQVAAVRARGAQVYTAVPDLTAMGRPNEVAQVLANLLENALRYAPGTPITVLASRRGDVVEVRVEDEGPGIPVAERQAVFRRGVRGSQTRDVSGTGLGLYVSALLMKQQGGGLRVEQAPGGGAAFIVELPAPTDGSAGVVGGEVVAEGEEGGEELGDAGQLASALARSSDDQGRAWAALRREGDLHLGGGNAVLAG